MQIRWSSGFVHFGLGTTNQWDKKKALKSKNTILDGKIGQLRKDQNVPLVSSPLTHRIRRLVFYRSDKKTIFWQKMCCRKGVSQVSWGVIFRQHERALIREANGLSYKHIFSLCYIVYVINTEGSLSIAHIFRSIQSHF